MKAAVLHEIGQPFRIEDVPVPEIGAEDVLIETRSCGICRTDLHIQDGLAYVPSLPHVPGHEPAGVVSAVGERVQGISVGDRRPTRAATMRVALTPRQTYIHERGEFRNHGPSISPGILDCLPPLMASSASSHSGWPCFCQGSFSWG